MYDFKTKKFKILNPLDTGCKLIVYKTFRGGPGRPLKIFYTVNVNTMSRVEAVTSIKC